VSDGKVAFSFDVPEKWLTETRHSGEKQLSIEEMRDFLATNYNGDIKTNPKLTSDYVDLPWSELKKMTPEAVKRLYYKSDDPWLPFPNVSVSAWDEIGYIDTEWVQIDFFILNDFNNQQTFFNKVRENRNSGVKGWSTKDSDWTTEVVGGLGAEVVSFSTTKDEMGNEVISKAGAGGKIYFIRINNGRDMFIIDKQAKGNSQFETDFRNIIQTFKFEGR
jgi:hypothetical protein